MPRPPSPWQRVWSLPLRALLASAGRAAAAMPRGLELALGRAFGRLILSLRLFRNRIVEENIDRCLPDLTPARRAALLRANYEHYGIMFFEFAHFFSPIPGHYRRYAERVSRLQGKEIWDEAKAKGNGVLFFSAHLGWWEMSAAAAGLGGIRPTIVTTVLKPAWLHEKITACRSATGVAAAWHPGSMPAVLKALRKGGSVAFMNDQYAHPPMGVPVEVFGARVDTLAVVGALAKRTGAVVLPTYCLRRPDGLHVTVIEKPVDVLAGGDSPEAATQIVARHVEGWIRKHPEQWLWIHRRFKNLRPNEPMAAQVQNRPQ
ncbi:MAG: hypothetical protein HY925_15785 [Elusimicrobia bacterium]|nr:hypothetical protein [Elusimicrobiota bacterium]